MPSARESRAELKALTEASVAEAGGLLSRLTGTAEQRRLLLLDGVPGLIDYYAEGSAALAADFYDEQRDLAAVKQTYTTELVLVDRTVKIRRAIVWAAEPLFRGLEEDANKRLAEVVQLESARPYRDTITTNTRNDPQSVGWKRITNKCCGFCRMLADRGAVYREATARFAAHTHCDCSAAPVFLGADVGPEASVMQYRASKRGRTEEQRASLRGYLDTYYPD
jgi:hypothetical protein